MSHATTRPPDRHGRHLQPHHPGRAAALAALVTLTAALTLSVARPPGARPLAPVRAQVGPQPAALDWTVTAPAPAGTFFDPVGAAVAPDGSVVIADTGNARMVRLDPTGGVTAVWGGPGIGDGQHVEPLGVDVAPDGTVWVADQGRGEVVRWSADGRWLGAWTPSLPVDLVPSWAADDGPEDVAVMPDGSVAVRIGEEAIGRYAADGTRLAAWKVYDAVFEEVATGAAQLDGALAALRRSHRPSAGILGATRVMSSWSDPRHFLSAGPDGTLWVDTRSKVLLFGPDGERRGEVGGYGLSPGQFAGWGVAGISALADGGAWVVDSYGGRLFRFRADGGLAAWFVPPGPSLRDVAAAADGSMFVTTGGTWPSVASSVVRLTADGVLLGRWGASAGDPDPGGGIGVAPDGGIVVADPVDDRLLRYGADARYLGALGAPGSMPGHFNDPAGMQFVGENGTFAVADSGNHRFQVIQADGAVRGAFGRLGAGAGEFAFPRDVATHTWGYLAVADSGNRRLAYTHLYGNWAGDDVWPAEKLGGRPLDRPSGVVAVPGNDVLDSTLWVADTGNDRLVRQAYPDLRLIGGPGDEPGQFGAPRDIVADGLKRIYVADSGNHRVQQLSNVGQPLAAWGAFGRAPGQFDRPTALAFDRTGSLLVLDLGNRRVQRLDVAGQSTSLLALPDNAAGAEAGGRIVALPTGGYAMARGAHVVWLDEAGRRVREVRLPLSPGGMAATYEIGAAADGGLWLTTERERRVVGLGPDGAVRHDWVATLGATNENCVGIAGAPDGGVYRLVGTYSNSGHLERWSAEGVRLARYPLVVGTESLGPASGGNQTGRLGVSPDGTIAVLGYNGNSYRVWRLTSDGKRVAAWNVGGTSGAGGSSPVALAVTGDGAVLVATENYGHPEGYSRHVLRFTPSGALQSDWVPPTDGCAAPRMALENTPSLAAITARPTGGVLVSWQRPQCLEAWSVPTGGSSDAWRVSIHPDADLAERPVIVAEATRPVVAWPADMATSEPPALAGDAAWLAVPPRGAGIRLERRFTTMVTTTLNLDTRARGGVRLWVDGRLHIDEWAAPAVTRGLRIDALPPGRHHIRVDHRPAGTGAALSVGDPAEPPLATGTPLPAPTQTETATTSAETRAPTHTSTPTGGAAGGRGRVWLPWASRAEGE